MPELSLLIHLTELRLDNVCLEMDIDLSLLTPLPTITNLSLTGLDLGRWNFDDHCFLSVLATSMPNLERICLRCVNSIDEREMVGAFEFSDKYFACLRMDGVNLERNGYNQLAGRHRE